METRNAGHAWGGVPTTTSANVTAATSFASGVNPPILASRLIPRPGAFDGIRSLDGAWLEATLDGVEAQVTYQHGLAEVVDAVRTGEAAAAILIRPVDIVEIERTARQGLLMPPKSTFFTPKLRTGLVVRPLD